MHAAVVAGCALLALPAVAATTGLALIPTADMLGKEQWTFDLQFDRALSGSPEGETWLFNTEVQLGERLELGFDLDLSEGGEEPGRALFNFKFLLYEGERFGAAAGVWSITSDGRGYPFLAAKVDLSKVHLHAGMLQSEGEAGRRERPFVGVDVPIGETWAAMADYTGGEENYSSVALAWCPTERWGGLVGAQFPNAGGEALWTFHLWFVGRYTSGSRWPR